MLLLADAWRFYATLSTGGDHYLVAGDIAARTMTVLHEIEDAVGGTDVWVASADGATKPVLLLRQTYSPTVER